MFWPTPKRLIARFQSQGRFFGGCCPVFRKIQEWNGLFQSQGRFFGGCCWERAVSGTGFMDVSIAGAILWGVLLAPTMMASPFHWVSIAGAILWGVLPHGLPLPD